MADGYLGSSQVTQRRGISKRTLTRAESRSEIAPASGKRVARLCRDAGHMEAYRVHLVASTPRPWLRPSLPGNKREPRADLATKSAAARRHLVELEWLCDVAREVNNARSLDDTLDVVYEAIRQGLGYDRVGINLFDHEARVFEDCIGTDAEGRKLVPANRRVLLAEDSPLWRFPGIAALLRGADLYYTADATAECPPELRYLYDGAPTHNLMVPLRARERVVGLISVDNLLSGRPIAPDDARPLLAIANQVGTAVERARAMEALQRERDFTTAIVETASSLVLVLDRHGHIVRFNRACEQTTGFSAVEVTGRPFWEVAVAPEDIELVQRTFADLGPGHIPPTFEKDWVTRAGQRRHIAWSTAMLLDAEGRPEYVITTGIDITERQRAEEALRHQALHDALTGLPNRTLLHDRLGRAIVAARRDGTPLALLLLDLDRFKEVNDTFGHHHGDVLLQQVSVRLRGTLRASDTIARLGGDEFAVLLTGSDERGAVETAHKILSTIAMPLTVEGMSVQVGTSIGLALSLDHDTDTQELLRRADVAMYVAKRQRSGLAVYSPELDQHNPERLTLVAALRQAIERDELELHYQPLVDARSGQTCFVEALARWQHPRRGPISPAQFIPLAEQTGLIEPLTQWALAAALRQCRAWRRAGLHLGVAVNLSMWNLHADDLPATISALLSRYGVPPTLLRLELTESAIIADAQRAQDVLERLAALGVRLSIDDFGAGYTSLAYLRRLPVDELKVDMSFVRRMVEDAADAAIVRSIVDLGHHLGLRVVAEGVEDEATLRALAAMGCDVAQGYHLSRPLPASALGRWLRAAS